MIESNKRLLLFLFPKQIVRNHINFSRYSSYAKILFFRLLQLNQLVLKNVAIDIKILSKDSNCKMRYFRKKVLFSVLSPVQFSSPIEFLYVTPPLAVQISGWKIGAYTTEHTVKVLMSVFWDERQVLDALHISIVFVSVSYI